MNTSYSPKKAAEKEKGKKEGDKVEAENTPAPVQEASVEDQGLASKAPEMTVPKEPEPVYKEEIVQEEEKEDEAVVPGYDPQEALESLGMDGAVRHEQQSVDVIDAEDYSKLKKYSVIVATLSQADGVEALKKFFNRDGINYFVVRGTSKLFYFVIYSTNSREEALKARADFLVQHTVDKDREEIWLKYYIPLTDAFILERK